MTPCPTRPSVVSSVEAEVDASGAVSASSSEKADRSEVTLRTRLTARRYFASEVYCRLGYRASSQSRWTVNGGL